MLSRQSVGTHQVNELTRKSSGNARPESSQLAESRWPDPSPSSGTISVSGTDTLELTSVHLKKKEEEEEEAEEESAGGELFVKPSPISNPRMQGKATCTDRSEQNVSLGLHITVPICCCTQH